MTQPYYRLKVLAVFLLAIYCLAFFRADSTQESMIRAILLEQNEGGWTVGLLYQAPEASADSSKASAEIQFAAAQDSTLEKALTAAQEALPQAANYRLCDYLLLAPGCSWQTLGDYEALVLAQQCGRTAASVQVCGFDCEELSAESEESEKVLASLLDTAKEAAEISPHLYEKNLSQGLLLPRIVLENGEAALREDSFFLTQSGGAEWDSERTELYRLLTGQGGVRRFWPDGHPLELRRCTISVTCHGAGEFTLHGSGPDPRQPLHPMVGRSLHPGCERTLGRRGGCSVPGQLPGSAGRGERLSRPNKKRLPAAADRRSFHDGFVMQKLSGPARR